MTYRAFGTCLVLGGALMPASVVAQSEYRVVAVTDGATLTGRVVFEGDVPRARRFLITKDVEVCGLGYRERREVDVSDDRGLRNVVISIEGITEGKAWPTDSTPHAITQENCVFAPHVQVVPRGVELDILNPDPVLHNIHGFESIGRAWRTLFNFGQPPEEPKISHVIRPRRGNHIRLECDAHDFMLGWIYAADHPYAVTVDVEGQFVLDDIPPGTYTVTAWHPYLGSLEQTVTLTPETDHEIIFRFTRN